MTAVVLVAVLLQGSVAAQDQSQSPLQTPAQMQQVLHKAQEKDKAVRVILNKKINNQNKLSGRVSGISDTSFVVDDEKSGTATTVEYSDVRKVSQKGLSTATRIVIVVAVVVGVVVAIAAAVYPKT
jgi:hypothetical protein